MSLSTLLQIATTIGRVAGALAGAPMQRMVSFGPTGYELNPQLGQVIFFKSNRGELCVHNQSLTEMAIIYLPGNPELLDKEPHWIYLNPGGTAILDLSFSYCADIGVDEFQILPAATPSTPSADAGEDKGTKVAVSTGNLRSNITVKVGPYFNFTLTGKDRTVLVAVIGGLTLMGIVALNIRGAGATAMNLFGVRRQDNPAGADDESSMLIKIEDGVDLSAGISHIDLTAEIGGLTPKVQSFVEQNQNMYRDLTDAERDEIAHYSGDSFN